MIKFMAQTYSYVAFISFIISWTFTLSPASSVRLEIPTDTVEAKRLFKEDENIPGNTLVRFMTWEFEEWMILAWVVGKYKTRLPAWSHTHMPHPHPHTTNSVTAFTASIRANYHPLQCVHINFVL